MAFPQTLTAYPTVTDGVTTLGSAQHGPYKAGLELLEKITVGPIWINAIGAGCDPTGAADSSAAAIAAIASMGTAGGTLFFPPGTYRMDTLVKVPSLTKIQGAGWFTTRFFAPAGSADIYMFEVATIPSNTATNVYSQVYGVAFQDFEIRDRASSDTLKLQSTGRSEDHHGILVHDSDWSIIQNVNFRDLQGTALNFSNVAREWLVLNCYFQNCGDAAETAPAINIGSSSGDATNTIYFYACRVAFSTYIGVFIGGSQDGIRLINFTDCQFEGGGNGSAGSYGNPHPYDIIWVARVSDLSFNNCEWSNPGSAKWCLNVEGYDGVSQFPFRLDINGARFNGNSMGGGIRCNRFTTIGVSQAWWQGCTAAQADYYVETVAGAIYADLSNIQSTNPTAGSPAGHFRGKETSYKFNLGDMRLDMPGGGVTSHTGGKPTENMGLGAAAPNGIHKVYDIANFLWWDRIFQAGVGDMWMVESGQVAGRKSEVGHASNTSENSVYSYTIPAASMWYFCGFKVHVWGEFSGTGVGTATLRIKLGGTTIFQGVTVALVSGVQVWDLNFDIRQNGVTLNAQRLGGIVMVSALSVAATGVGAMNTDEQNAISPIGASSTIDMNAADRVLEVTWQHSAAKVTTVRGGYGEWK